MNVGSSFENGLLRLYLEGELDHHAAKRAMIIIEDKVDSSLPRECVIDMAHLTFMDSSGIAVVLKTYKLMTALGGKVWIENAPKQAARVLDAAGIDRIVKMALPAKEA